VSGGEVSGLVVVMLGVAVTVGAARALRRGQQSAAWPTVSGVVVTSRVAVLGADDDWVRADVTYEYEVASRPYLGARIRFGYRGGPRRGSAEELVAAYPVGRPVAVHHDPLRLHESVLRPGKDPMARFGFVAGMLIVVAGFVVFASG